ncbi:sigma-70 family RNA polymerase sigma factor [Archangium lansingense]|uniref:Sigma-70 family RNA polymerase sigma factor n=1 Tax=Archangium lansingense TaxID=2995310 RepID=A0ABT4A7Q0_9BACT|nr:sigma-70 family RNA polymerase sigma factor [Archangium lansinium]MCY1077667.1 sigma-70 family RNA polymerase sigma factor [Archangium lansinium]
MEEKKPSLMRIFLEHMSVPVGVPADADDFESQLRCAWEAGRDPWPQVALSAEVFVRYLAQRLDSGCRGMPLALVLNQLSQGDLYLACACVHGMPGAIAALESHYMAKLPALLGFLKRSPMLIDDVCQLVRIHLLVGSNGSGPKLADYTGRGSLLSWIRVMAVRIALRLGGQIRETVPEENLTAAIVAMPEPGADTELELIRRRYRREFRRAMHEAFAELSSVRRYQLRLHFIERLSTTQMGAMFYVNQSTVSRWLKHARQAIREGTKRRLQERFGLFSKEFMSLWNAIESQFDLSISQIFREEE